MMRHIGKIVLSLCCLAWLCQSPGISAPPFDKPTQTDIATLDKATMFCIGGFGIAGSKTPPELALRRLLQHPDAVVAFKQVLKEGTYAGKLYALLGLKLKASLLPKYSEPFAHLQTPVPVGRGCILGKAAVSKIASEIKTGEYDESFAEDNNATVNTKR